MSDLDRVDALPQDQRVLLRPLVETTRWFWFWAVSMALIAAWGAIAYYLQVVHGWPVHPEHGAVESLAQVAR